MAGSRLYIRPRRGDDRPDAAGSGCVGGIDERYQSNCRGGTRSDPCCSAPESACSSRVALSRSWAVCSSSTRAPRAPHRPTSEPGGRCEANPKKCAARSANGPDRTKGGGFTRPARRLPAARAVSTVRRSARPARAEQWLPGWRPWCGSPRRARAPSAESWPE